MNTKRQTIWLVSMLGLMVVLSAYYLFTDNVNDLQKTSQLAQDQHDQQADAVEAEEQQVDIDLEQALDGATSSAATTTEDSTQTDEKILQKVQAGALSADEQLAELDRKRTDQLSHDTERLMQIAQDTKRSATEVGQAEEQLQRLEETQAVVSDLEDRLMREYENVVVTQERDQWRVVVKASSLKKSEAVKILDMAMAELKVGPAKVSVEWIQ